MNVTKRNHYNPCFWMALWNEDYFAAVVAGREPSRPSREQRVYALNVRSGTIYPTIVKNVHYDKQLGLAKMSPESIKDFCRRRFPSEHDKVASYVDEHPETLVMDFESILTDIEDKHTYRNFIEAAKIGGFSSTQHKGFISCLLILHAMRSHEFMAAMISGAGAAGIEKWEYFWFLKNAWASRYVLARAVSPLGLARWTLYRTDRHRFPLCDSPVMINRDNVMMVLSPRLLAEIDLTVQKAEDEWLVLDKISASKYREFRRRCIQNSFKEIIFPDRGELEEWKRLPEFRARMRAFESAESEGEAVSSAAQRVGWAVSGFGRVPADFERWVGPMLDAAGERVGGR
jgi:hypothetical protein